jgi:hypothetical protein
MVFSVRKGVGFDFDAKTQDTKLLDTKTLDANFVNHFDGILTLFPKRNSFQILVYFWFTNGCFLWQTLPYQNGTKHPIS